MKSILALIFLILFSVTSATAAAKKSDMPFWMVKVVKTTETQKTITGAGYIVKFKGRLFVRTASHLTLGSMAGVALTDSLGRGISFDAARFATNNRLDDQLIEIQSQDLQPLAVYNTFLDKFLVTKDAYTSYVRHSRKVALELDLREHNTEYEAHSFVSPPWVKRQEYRFKNKPRNALLRTFGDVGFERNKNKMRPSQLNDVLVADISIMPGESGSAIVGWSDTTSLEQKDLDFAIQLAKAMSAGFYDDQGQLIDVMVSERGSSVVYLKGHAISYHRKFKLSMFASSDGFKALQDNFDKNLSQDIGQTSWKLTNKGAYRIYSSNGLTVGEIFNAADLAGDGTSGDGGDGTSGDGGDGTSGDGGGPGRSQVIPFGLQYNDQRAIAFQLIHVPELKLYRKELKVYFESEAYLAATWHNFVLLNRLQSQSEKPIYKVIYDTVLLTQFFTDRFAAKGVGYRSRELSCVINFKKLVNNVIAVKIRLGAIEGDEVVFVEAPLSSFSNLRQVNSKKFGPISLDLSALWGLDLRFVGEQFNPEDDLGPSISVLSSKYAIEKYPCGME